MPPRRAHLEDLISLPVLLAGALARHGLAFTLEAGPDGWRFRIEGSVFVVQPGGRWTWSGAPGPRRQEVEQVIAETGGVLAGALSALGALQDHEDVIPAWSLEPPCHATGADAGGVSEGTPAAVKTPPTKAR